MITIFHEPINIRAENVARIEAEAVRHGIGLKTQVFATTEAWRDYALNSLVTVERIAKELGIHNRLHLWPDKSLGSKKAIESQPNPEAYQAWLQHWWTRISEWPKDCKPNPSACPAAVVLGNCAADDAVTIPVVHIDAPVEPVANPLKGNGETGETNSPDSPNSPTPQALPASPERYYPEASLIREIVNYLHGQIETPKLFITAGALTLVSVALNRNVYYVWGDKLHYPSLYQVLVGPSGVTRKSELASRIAAIIDELWSDRTLADYTSVERLIESLANQPLRAIIQSEGKMFIDKLNQSPNLANAIIKLYDCEDLSTDFKKDKKQREKKKSSRKNSNDGGRIAAKNTFLTILTGIVPDAWQLSKVNQAGGLMGRFQLLFAEKRDHEILDAPPVCIEERQRLIDALRALGQLHGEMKLSPDAAKAFREIQSDNRRRMDVANDIVNSNLSRMPFTIIKTAMLYEVAMSSNLTISLEALQLAQNFVELGHRCYVHFFDEMSESWQKDRLVNRIVVTLRRNGGRLSHSELLRQATRHGEWDANAFKAELRVLSERKVIRLEPNSPAHYPDVVLVEPAVDAIVTNPKELQ